MNSLFRIIKQSINNIDSDKNISPFVINKIESNQIYEKKESINSHSKIELQKTNLSESTKINKSLNDIKYWEFGNSGFKIKHFNNRMAKNLSILFYIDKIFSQLLDEEKINIHKIFNKNFNQSFLINSSKIDCINSNVSIDLNHGKISGLYNIIAVGSTTISNVKILPDELKKYRVPDLDNILSDLDNLKQIIKLTNILKLYNNFDIKNDISDASLNFFTIITNSLNIIDEYRNLDKEKKLLKSSSTNAIYIKIYDTHGKAFIIDNDKKLIYYITEKILEKNHKIILKYYILSINDSCKII